jgi:SNF2 family DNA or RNA helicase
MPQAFVEMNEARDAMEIYFPYDATAKEKIKEIKGWRFVGKDQNPPNGPHWTVPLNLDAARALREIFGSDLKLGNAVRAWGRDEVQMERNLKSLSIADDAVLVRIPTVAPIIARIIAGDPIPEFKLPKKHPLMRKRPARPYQRADIMMMAQANVINANQMGTGKTLEVIGAMVEAGLEDGPHLVCAPRRSLVNVWKDEVERCLPGHKFFTSEDARERYQQINLALDAIEAGEKNVWIGVIFDDLRVKTLVKHNDRDLKNSEKKEVSKKDPMYARADHQGSTYAYNGDLHKCIVDIQWAGFVVDEFHKSGLNNPMSLFTLGTDMLHHERTIKMSGTPMGGKPIKLFPVLRSIEPKMFSNKWRWIGNWLDVDEGFKGHKKVGGLKPGKEDEFYDYHARYMVRRLKREALPGLPPKVIEVVMTPMTPKQLKQYRQFADDAEVRIEGTNGSKLIVGNCILAEYSRLKQFANGFCILNDQDEVIPTEDSGKLPYLLEKLDELGVRKEDPEPAARAIIASQSKRMVYMVVEWLRKQGIEADSLTGDTKDSKPIIDRFRDTDNEDPYCIVMTTETGGVSLNLEEAGSVHILDESWTPDDDEQLEDRGDRGSRTTPLVCIYYRTKGSVQEYIAEVAEGKKVTNKNVLDVYREMRKMEEQQVAA